MPFDKMSLLWPQDHEFFYRESKFQPIKQNGPHCVATVLAMLSRNTPERYQHDVINTQNPVSWSDSLDHVGMKLAYCPTDCRKLKHYMDELVRLDDLFTLSYYTPNDDDQNQILREPNNKGWVIGSHIVVLHRDQVLDPASGTSTDVSAHQCIDHHTKRIFRVVPKNYPRGL